MNLSGLNGIEFIEAAFRTDASVKSAAKINALESEISNSGFKKFPTQDQKNSIVSRDSDSQNSVYSHDFKLKNNTPTASLNHTDKIPQRQIKEKDFHKTYLRYASEDFEENIEKTESEKIGKGYYIVLNSPNNPDNTKKIEAHINPFLERVKETYGLIFKKEPGMLVDLTY